MVHLDNATWEHGESVVILSKRELQDFIRLVAADAGLVPGVLSNRSCLQTRLENFATQMEKL